MQDADTMTRESRIPTVLLPVVAFLWLGWLVVAVVLAYQSGGQSQATAIERAGQMGDTFGALNALFTAGAFAVVAWSGYLQRQELKLQRRELELQRLSQELQRKELEDTRGVIAQQTFEATFFQMLRLVKDLYDDIRVPALGLSGSAAVAHLSSLAKDATGMGNASGRAERAESERQAIGIHYTSMVYKDNEAFLGPYFRTLYHLIRLVDRQQHLTDADKRVYSNLARAHLSAPLLVILAANCCADVGAEFRPYLNHYGLLKHYPLDYLVSALSGGIFEPSAFRGVDEPGSPAK